MISWANPLAVATGLAGRGRAKENARQQGLVILDLKDAKERRNAYEHYLRLDDGEETYDLPVYRQRAYENRSSDLSPKELFFYAEKMGKVRKVSLFNYLQGILTKKDEMIVVRGQALPFPPSSLKQQLHFYQSEEEPRRYLCLLANKNGVKRYKLGEDFSDLVLSGEWGSLLNFSPGGLGDVFFVVLVPIVKNGRRDLRHPIHLYVNFLLKTKSGEPSKKEIEEISAKLERVFEDPIYAGKLICTPEVLPEVGKLPKWWDSFWRKNGDNIGLEPMTTLRLLQKRLGQDYMPKSEKTFRDDVADLLVLTDW